MKYLNLSILVIVIIILSTTAFADNGAGTSFVSATSDCTSLTMTYRIQHTALSHVVDYEIIGTGINQTGSVSATRSQHTETIDLSSSVANTTILTVTIGYEQIEDTIVITCYGEGTPGFAGVIEPASVD